MELETTGERVIEDAYRSSPERYLIYLFHLVTYQFARSYVEGGTVLDYGCGSGYGAHYLAPHCGQVIGVDVSKQAIEFARSRYQGKNLSYRSVLKAEQAPLPFSDNSFDSVVSFQVIEHIRHVDVYLHEIRRVLRPGGVFICATPDRSTRLLPGQKPWNVWHIKEYDKAGFARLLMHYFADVNVFGMGGREDVLAIELKRAQRNMWLTLPFTLPFLPQALRAKSLSFLGRLMSRMQGSTADERLEFDFDETDVTIAKEIRPSVNLIAVTKNL